MTDINGFSAVQRGRLSYDMRRNPDFKKQVEAAKAAQRADAALQEMAEQLAEARRQRQQEREERRANSTGSVARGRARWEETHPKPQPAQEAGPLDTGLDPANERIHDTERTGQRGLLAGRERFNQKNGNNNDD